MSKRLFPSRTGGVNGVRKQKPSSRGSTETLRANLVRCPLCSRFIPADVAFLHVEGSTCVRKTPLPEAAPAEYHFCYRKDAQGKPSVVWSCSTSSSCSDNGTGFWAQVSLRGGPGNPSRRVVLHLAPDQVRVDGHESEGTFEFSPQNRCPSLRLTPSVLKSALQKNVRRGRPGPAVRVAVGLIRRTSFVELVRRIQVIAIEDAVLCHSFPRLAWLTAAIPRGYQVQQSDVRMVLETVELLCAVNIRDVEAAHSAGDAETGKYNADTSGPLSQEMESLVQSLRVRAAYGGMAGDTSMLVNAARVWEGRFREDSELWWRRIGAAFDQAKSRVSPSIALTAFSAASKILKGDIPPAALDFHCCNISQDLAREVVQAGADSSVYRRFGRDCQDGIERLMWLYSSSTTSKLPSSHGRWPDGPHVPEEVQAKVVDAPGLDRLLWDTELLPQARRWTRSFLQRVGL